MNQFLQSIFPVRIISPGEVAAKIQTTEQDEPMKVLQEWRDGIGFPPYDVAALQAGIRQIVSNISSLMTVHDRTKENGGDVTGFNMSLQEERQRLADYKELVELCKKRDRNGGAG